MTLSCDKLRERRDFSLNGLSLEVIRGDRIGGDIEFCDGGRVGGEGENEDGDDSRLLLCVLFTLICLGSETPRCPDLVLPPVRDSD